MKGTARGRLRRCPSGEAADTALEPRNFKALRSCTGVKLRIGTVFQSFAPPKPARAAHFTLIFQGLEARVKRCCSNAGLLLPSECVGGHRMLAVGSPSRWPRHSPLRLTGADSLRGHHFNPASQRKRRCPFGIITSRPFGPKGSAETFRDALTLEPRTLILSQRTPARHPSGLAPNERLPVTWLQHLPIKINA